MSVLIQILSKCLSNNIFYVFFFHLVN
jgi:hypothetical protein